MNSTSQMGLMKTYFHNSLFKAAYMNKILAISPHFAHMYLLYALFVWHFNEYTIKLYFILYSIAKYPHHPSEGSCDHVLTIRINILLRKMSC